MWPVDEEITWTIFKEPFRKYHIPAGIMKVKQCEFLALTQGSPSTLVNKALIVEREQKPVHDNRPTNNDHKRKFEPKKDGQPVQKARTWQQTQVEYKPNWQQNVNKTTTQVKNVVTSPMREECQHNNSCFNYGQTIHYARQCPKNGKPNAPSRPQVNHMELYLAQKTIQGQVHHLSANEAQEDPEVVIAEGIYVVPSKVKDVLDWTAPTTVFEIRSFLGLDGYYRRFIEGFSKIAKPMTELLKKDKKFEWTEDYEKSFNELKTRQTTAPVLTLPDIYRTFDV
nr:uncharacterized protein LOC109746294 [Aegilops tauschii subsp. strangulata]